MGVPAFYRWLREKYRKCIADVDERGSEWADVSGTGASGPEFDALYIDMNGIIHPCVHPEDIPAPETEEDMFAAIFAYVDRLVAAVRPSRVLYLAIDGVAPRAKMNQQRSRRFKTAADMSEEEAVEEMLKESLRAKGQRVPPRKKATFDHNVITPGTAFMDRLALFLRYYIAQRVNAHPLWRGLRVVLSDASVPGEGEHKIMEFIRQQRSQPGYSPAMRHCLHGLDADLIMLGLATHEPFFTILREDVLGKGGGSTKCFICGGEGHRADSCTGTALPTPKPTPAASPTPREGKGDSATDRSNIIQRKPLQYLHLHILREYLDLEFRSLSTAVTATGTGLPFGYDIERLIDDFVFMCFFVGNDFLPHLPSMDIREGAIDLMLALYRQVLPSLGGYLTHNGDVDLARVDVLLSRIGDVEDEIFRRRRSTEERDKRREASRPQGTPQASNKEAMSDKQRSLEAATEGARKALDAGIASIRQEPANKRARAEGAGGVPTVVDRPKDNQSAAAALRASLLSSSAVATEPAITNDKPEEAGAISGTKRSRADMSGGVDEAAEGPMPSPSPQPSPGITIEEALEDGLLEEEVTSAISSIMKSAVLKALLERRTHNEVTDEIQLGVAGWRERYYQSKFGREDGSNPKYIQEMCRKYTEGLVWVFKYYYEGVASWDWYYPYHYAPFASSLRNLDTFAPIKFDLGKPFRPLDQLMSVLPARSSHALPAACAELMMDDASPIKHFYPEKFDTDPNGKKFSWQWVVLLPFIDEKALISAIDSVSHTFNEDEKRRNMPGNDLVFVHSSAPMGKFLLPLIPTESKEAESQAVAPSPPAKVPVVVLRPHMGDAQNKGLSAQCVAVAESPVARRGVKAYPLGGTYPSPFPSMFADVTKLLVVCVTFCPPPHRPHSCTLLPGVELPSPILDPLDDDPSLRVPKLSRAMNIADLAYAISLHTQARGRGDERMAYALASGQMAVGAGGTTMGAGGYYGTAVAYEEPRRYQQRQPSGYPRQDYGRRDYYDGPPPPRGPYGGPPSQYGFAPQQMALLSSVGAGPGVPPPYAPPMPQGSHTYFDDSTRPRGPPPMMPPGPPPPYPGYPPAYPPPYDGRPPHMMPPPYDGRAPGYPAPYDNGPAPPSRHSFRPAGGPGSGPRGYQQGPGGQNWR